MYMPSSQPAPLSASASSALSPSRSECRLPPLDIPVPTVLVASARTARKAGPEPTHVLKSATELFLAREGHSLREITVFRELALNLLPATDVAVRREMSCGLALHPDTPGDVLVALAGDSDPFTAFPLLHHVEELPDDVLIRQVERGPDGLRKTIAERPWLSDAVVDALLRHSGAGVIEALLLRDDVELTGPQIDSLLKRPDAATGFGNMLRYKVRLTDGQLMGHFLYLTPEERPQAIAAAELFTLAEMGRKGLTRPLRPTFKPTVLHILQECAMAPDPALFMAEMTYALKLPRAFVERMVREDDGQTLTIALKALGFERHVASAILIRMVGARVRFKALRDLVRLYGGISHGAAMLLVDRWISAEAGVRKVPAGDEGVFQQSVQAEMAARDSQMRDESARSDQPRRVGAYQETVRPAARRADHTRADSGSSEDRRKDYPWREIEEIENILKFG